MVNVEKGPRVFTEVGDGAEAAVALVNERGGIRGHRLVLTRCQTDSSPETSQDCATKAAAANPTAIVIGFEANNAGLYKVAGPLGIPVVGAVPASDADFAQTNASFFGAGTLSVLSFGRWATTDAKAKNVSIISSNSPTALQSINTLAVPFLKNAGVSVAVSPVSSSGVDFVPVATSAVSTNPDVIYVFASGAACSGSVQALKSLNYTGKVVLATACGAASIISAAGAASDGVLLLAGRTDFRADAASITDPAARAELALYLDTMKRFKPAALLGDFNAAGFATVIDTAEVMAGIQGSVTPATLTAALHAATGADFLGDRFDCRGTLFPKAPSVCVSASALFKISNAGLTTSEATPFIDAAK